VRVLVVDDEKRLAAALRRGLQNAGYAVDVALDGEEGLWMATEHQYDAIVLDIMLPKLNGYEVCSALRERSVWTPILMLTARDRAEDETRSLDTGADDYLSKPFSFMVLQARLRALIRRGGEPRPRALEAGSLRLDPAARKFWAGGEQVALTAREFSILEFMMRQPGTVLSKLDILENVWDFGFDGDPNIVEVYIGRLRQKLGSRGGTSQIITVRGAGYRLDA
jgi:two-component system, OmpR family, response regulator